MALADEVLEQAASGQYQRDVVPFRHVVQQLQQPVDTVAESVEAAQESNMRAKAEAARFQRRYGIQLTPAERQQQAQVSQLAGQANVAGAGNFARRRDDQSNLVRLSALSQLYSSQREGALTALGNLGAIAAKRKNAYENARANSAAQHSGFLGNIAGQVGSFLGGRI